MYYNYRNVTKFYLILSVDLNYRFLFQQDITDVVLDENKKDELKEENETLINSIQFTTSKCLDLTLNKKIIVVNNALKKVNEILSKALGYDGSCLASCNLNCTCATSSSCLCRIITKVSGMETECTSACPCLTSRCSNRTEQQKKSIKKYLTKKVQLARNESNGR